MNSHAEAEAQIVKMTSSSAGGRCPACDSDLSEVWGVHLGVDIHRCSTCLSTFFDRPIVLANDYIDYFPDLRDSSNKRLFREREARRRQALAKLDVISSGLRSKPRTLLDVGSGPGYFASHVAELGIKADCIELNPDARRVAEELFSLRVFSLDMVTEGAYDAVTMFHVLEHIEDPLDMLLRVSRALRPGGLLMLHVPKSITLGDQVELLARRIAGKKAERRGCLYLPDHLTGFTEDGLQKIAARAGLSNTKIVSVSKFAPEYDPALWVFNARSPKFWLSETIQVFKGSLDSIFEGGTWLRLTADRPK
jgi:SAM-dependent methyltransferase